MKTNTPRTDAAQFIQHDMTAVVNADFARTLEAELAKAKAILASIEEDGTEEHNAAVRLRQELATERARLDWLLSRMGGNVLPVNGCVAWTVDVYHYKNQFPSRAAIDAAMKEGAP